MPKVLWNGVILDSQLEVDYYKRLDGQEEILFTYHHKYPIKLSFMEKGYTIDFIELHPIEDDMFIVRLIETKGYNQFSARVDNMIHSGMKVFIKDQEYFKDWYIRNEFDKHFGIPLDYIKEFQYQKIKWSSHANDFVDWSYKPPTRYDILKPKHDELKKEHKELKKKYKALQSQHKKDLQKHFYITNILAKDKPTKTQQAKFERLTLELGSALDKYNEV